MCNNLLIVFIKKLRNGDMQSFSVIFEEFAVLIDYYSRKVGEEDTSQELTVFLLELLYDIELSKFSNDTGENLHKYIAVCLRNKYIAISKENQRNDSFISELYESDSFYLDNAEMTVFLKEWLDKLSIKQRMIIIYRYIYNYSDVEIAQLLGISRQAVCRLKNRGLENLKKFYK